jgi:hypothetical protein
MCRHLSSTTISRSLSQLGWEIRVISANPYCYIRYDSTLLSLVPPNLEVIRVKGHNLWHAIQAWRQQEMLATLSKVSVEKAEHIYAAQSTTFRSFVRRLVRKIETCYFIPDEAMPWIRPAIDAASKACISKKPKRHLGHCHQG